MKTRDVNCLGASEIREATSVTVPSLLSSLFRPAGTLEQASRRVRRGIQYVPACFTHAQVREYMKQKRIQARRQRQQENEEKRREQERIALNKRRVEAEAKSAVKPPPPAPRPREPLKHKVRERPRAPSSPHLLPRGRESPSNTR